MAERLEAESEIISCAAMQLRDLAAVSEALSSQFLNCNACDGPAVMDYEGTVTAPQCNADDTCQRSAIELHPDLYFTEVERQADTIKQVGCGNCGTIVSALACANEVITELNGADCRLDTSAIAYWLYGRDLLNNMKLEANGAGVPTHGCIGQFVTGLINRGFVLEAGSTYTCPLSAGNGEHCRSQLTIDPAGNLVTVSEQEPEAWENNCLLERTGLSQEELSRLDQNW